MENSSKKVSSKNTSFLIVGAGTVGLSTALHLTERGYKDVTVIDREVVPSPYSAGNDLNKIVRADYEDHFYAGHALEAIRAWSSPFWSSCYRQTGYAVTTSANAPQKATTHMQQVISSITSHPECPKGSIVLTPDADAIRRLAPQLSGSLPGWTGYFNKHAGYAKAGLALKKAYEELRRRGVRFELGEAGEAVELLQSTGSEHPQVRARSGAVYTADKVIVALGAHTPKLLPSTIPQLTAKSWAVGHIQLTPEEAQSLHGMPVVNCRDLGFFFEPDPDTSLIKLCAHGGGYTNYSPTATTIAAGPINTKQPTRVSLPPTAAESHAGIPTEDEKLLRRLLDETLPQFQDRPLVRKLVCWCSDTRDSEYIIDYIPGSANVILAGGDSGHAFKMFPIFGKWVVELLESGEQSTARWKWKEVEANSEQEDIAWRVGNVRDLKDVSISSDEVRIAVGKL